MRADVNISVREVGAKKFGTRTEMKNLNSFKAIAHAIEGERERQIELLEMALENSQIESPVMLRAIFYIDIFVCNLSDPRNSYYVE